MKSILAGKKVEDQDEYPILKIHPGPGRVVLFSKPRTGTILHDPTENFTVGNFRRDWCETMFEPLKGKIILSN